MIKFLKYAKGILLRSESSTISYDSSTEGVIYNHNNTKLRTHIQGSDRELLTADQTQTVTGKSIDADSNTITNIENADIKAAAAIDATKIANGSVSNTEFQYLDGVTSSIQTQFSAKLTSTLADSNVFIGSAGNLAVPNPISGDITLSNTGVVAIATGVIVNADINASAAIDATKIADGSVSNAEFQYLGNVTSDIQTQLNTNATNISNHLADTIDAHDASAISVVPAGNLASTDVQAALEELQTSIDGALTNPMDSAGDMIYGGTGGVATKLDSGTAQTWLVSGGAGAPTWTNTVTTGKFIDGSADEIQLRLQGHSTQTSDILSIENSGATSLFKINTTAATTTLPHRAANGSAAAPSYDFTASVGTGMYSGGGNQLDFATGASQRLSLNSARTLSTVPIYIPDGSNSVPSLVFSNSTATGLYRIGANQLGIAANGTGKFEVNTTQVNIGNAALGNTAGYQLMVRGTDSLIGVRTTVDNDNMLMVDFRNNSNTQIGRIVSSTTGSTTSYLAGSDSRLKTNYQDFNGLDMVNSIVPRKFEWVNSPGSEAYGFIAQELNTVLPQAVSVGGEDVNDNPWMVDYSKVVPILCKAIKELKDQNDELKARIETLEQG